MATWRVIVQPRDGMPDPQGSAIARHLADLHASPVRSAKIYLIDIPVTTAGDASGAGGAESRRRISTIASELLTDPVCEVATCETDGDAEIRYPAGGVVEIHLKPGVMDVVANATLSAIEQMGIHVDAVRAARRFSFARPVPPDAQSAVARRLGNGCIEDVVFGIRPLAPAPTPPVYRFELRHVSICNLDAAGLDRLSRDGHLFLSRDEMTAIQSHYRSLKREPTDLELETTAQTWSEHCIHKTLKSAIDYRGAPMPSLESGSRGASPEPARPGQPPVTLHYDNLLKDTIAAATDELMRAGRGPQCLSVFKDNAGIIAFDDEYGIAVKVETHNHPSAIEPYGGAATGVGGVIRDVLGCGLGAKPIANTDVFCVAPPDWPDDAVPRGVIHPRTVLRGVVSGVRDYGNCMGIPTVNGAVQFDPRYLGNPLVYCGSIGLIPRDRIEKAANPGDAIVVIGGRTGRDGIHGATFSSAELTDTHTDEFAHAVQIGNPLEEKKVLDLIMLARDYTGDLAANAPRRNSRCLFSAITDCGAGGLSSAIGEMAEQTGAVVDMEKVTLKYAGLRYDEIWISEAQERMVLAVPPEEIDTFMRLAASEDVEATVVGQFTSDHRLIVRYQGNVVGDIDLAFLHGGIPKTARVAEWNPLPQPESSKNTPKFDSERRTGDGILAKLRERLSNPTIASKQWIIRQYDHEVQGRSVVKPLVGPGQGPSDAAVIRPRLDSDRGIAIGCGLAPDLYEADPYWMAVAGIDEAIRNVVCVGGDPGRTAILDNFCWPRVDDQRNLGALVRACQACHDMAMAYGVPFISGKDSLNNAFALDEADVERVRAVIETYESSGRPRGGSGAGVDAIRAGRLSIPGTLLITAVSLVDDVRRCVTMDLKHAGSRLMLVGSPMQWGSDGGSARPAFNAGLAMKTHRIIAQAIREGLVTGVHDVSDGGILVAMAEMAIGGNMGIELVGDWAALRAHAHWHGVVAASPMSEVLTQSYPAMYVVDVPAPGSIEHQKFLNAMSNEVAWVEIGIARTSDDEACTLNGVELGKIWRQPLDW